MSSHRKDRNGTQKRQYESHYNITQINLDKKGKTNKKLKRNANAQKTLTDIGEKLIKEAEDYTKEHFKKGRRTKIKEQKAEEQEEKDKNRPNHKKYKNERKN